MVLKNGANLVKCCRYEVRATRDAGKENLRDLDVVVAERGNKNEWVVVTRGRIIFPEGMEDTMRQARSEMGWGIIVTRKT